MEGGGTMGSMMGWMMGFGWLGALLVLILVVAAVVLLVRTVGRNHVAQATGAGATAAKILLIVLAVIGAVALVGAGSMAVMHLGMAGCCG